MKKRVLLLLAVCFSLSVSAQVTLWSERAGAASTPAETAGDIVSDKYGNSYIAGTFSGTTIIGNDTLTSLGSTDAYIAKIDKDGTWQWAKRVGGALADEGTAVYIAPNGNIYFGGNFNSTRLYIANKTDSIDHYASTNQNTFYVAYNSAGVLQSKNQDGYFSEAYYLNNFVVTASNDIISTGYIIYSSVSYFYLKKINTSGVTLWNAGGSSTGRAGGKGYGIYLDNAGTKVYVAGSWTNGFYPYGLSSPRLNQGGLDIFWLAASVSNGQTASTDYSTYGSSGTDEGKDIIVDASNFIYLAAEYGGSMNIGTGVGGSSVTLPAVTKDAFVMKISQTDVWYWYTRAGASSTYIDRLRMDRFGNFFVHGNSSGAVWNHNGSGVTRMYTVKLSKSEGSILWKYGGVVSSTTNSAGCGIDTLGNVYSLGTFSGTQNFGNGNSETSAGGNDIVVIKNGSINILYPTEGARRCANKFDGDTLKVYALPSYTLNAGNTYTVQLDTLASGIFASPITIGTLSSSSPGYISCLLPGFVYLTPSIRVTTSDIANTGEDIYLYMKEKPHLAGPNSVNRCFGATGTAIALTSTLPDDMGGFPSNTFSWSPTTNLSVSSPDDYHTTGTTTSTIPRTYTCTVTNYGGCKDTQAVYVNILPQPAVFAGNDTSICQGQALTMSTATSDGTTFAWTPTASFTNPTALNATTTTSTVTTTTYTLTATGSNGCVATDPITVTRGALPTVDAGPAGYTTCAGSSVYLVATGTNVTSYDWAPAATLNMTSNDSVTAMPTGTTTYTVTATRSNGCTKRDSIKITIGAVTINAGVDKTITCGTTSTLTTTLGSSTYQGPLTYSWLPATGLSSTTTSAPVANPIATTNYTVTMSTPGGCVANDTVKVNVNEANFSTAFSGSPQLHTSPPFVTQFTNTTPSMASYNFIWYWGDGTNTSSNNTTVFHTYQYNGTYDVTLVATSIATGCADTLFQGSYIFCTGGTTCTLTSTVTAPNGASGCTGDTVLLTCNTGAGYTYQWNFNGSPISGATSSTYNAIFPGNYSMSINDGSCTVVSQPVAVSFNAPPATPTITPQGSVSLCGSGTATLEANSGYAGYAWSTGASTQSISVNASGVYSVVVNNAAGCTASASYTLNASSASPPDICIAGVDSLTGKNLVVWNKPVTTEIDSFIIYREGIIANQFDRIGAQPYSAFSTFLDMNSNPQQQFYRYKLSLKDTCGTETLLSAYHKTIHLTINAGAGSTWNLLWNHYEGVPVTSYNIYRGTAPDNLSLLTTVSGSNNSYTDLTPPAGAVYYQLELIGPSCNPSMKLVAPSGNNSVASGFNASRSNIVNNGITGIAAADVTLNAQIMPNPNNGVFDVMIASDNIGTQPVLIQVFDEVGKIVFSKASFASANKIKENISLADLANGVYNVRVSCGTSVKNMRASVVK